MGMRNNIFYYILRSARPRQWLKSFAVFAPLVFSGWLFTEDKLLLSLYAFVLLSALSSGMYLINDVIDRSLDQKHPFKRFRPIASGELNPRVALFTAFVLITSAVLISFNFSPAFRVAVLAFLALQMSYSLFLKQVILIDVMAIAASFTIRVYAGAFIIGAHVNVWFLLAVISASLFLAIGKRRSELTILQGHGEAGQHRATLSHYPETLLDILTAMFATATWLTYALFTFNFPSPQPHERIASFLFEILPSTIEQSKWLMISVPFVIYGVMRYLYIIYEKHEGESPERIILNDKPLLITALLGFFAILIILYGLNPQ